MGNYHLPLSTISIATNPHLFLSVLSVSSTSSALQVALESLSPWEQVLAAWSFLEFLLELLTSSVPAVGGFVSVASLGGVGCSWSLLGSPVSVLISCLMESASSLTGGFSSPAWLVSARSSFLSPVFELPFALLEASSLALLSSDECGEGRLSVSELLLAPPGRDAGFERKQIRGLYYKCFISFTFFLPFFLLSLSAKEDFSQCQSSA